jgi:hypothetical protein
MCQYCQDKLETINYHFTDGVCKYQEREYSGNPIIKVSYY